ncbi:tRNA (guanine-N(1)-)-methyltransferase [Nymphon striatum]|nr:tRNA (guanine-N(1)-)-methyltransferase [Nymphon striatum]
MVTIRMARGGSKKRPFYNIVVTDSRKPRDSGYIERLGYYNPRARGQEVRLNLEQERVDHWLGQGAQLSTRGDWKPVKVVQGRMQGKSIVAQLENVIDRDQAEALIGSKIAITNDELDKLPEGEFYWKDLLGLTVKTIKDEELGVVDWLFDTGSNDVIVVKGEAIGEPERMIPFIIDDVVVSVDLENSLMILVESVTKSGVTGRAADRKLIDLQCWNPRDYTEDVHRTVDDRPYGGGPGMVMKADCLLKAIRDVKEVAGYQEKAKVIYLSPQGKSLDQAALKAMSNEDNLILLCGRYEGIDERIIELEVDEQWSLGDYVLSGGELGAMVMIDAVTRLLPGALGHESSANEDSFSESNDGLLDCPHYTRPNLVEDLEVPAVLKSGDHKKIARWRRKQALGRTKQYRSDLLENITLSSDDKLLLDEYLNEQLKI